MAAFQQVDWDRALTWLHSRSGAELAPEQEEAVRLALTERVAALTGGPCCGKGFTVRSIVELARARRARVGLVAPTGRAAKRLAELTGHEAATVHRLLQLQPGGAAKYDRDNPLDADPVVVDESSTYRLEVSPRLPPPGPGPRAGRALLDLQRLVVVIKLAQRGANGVAGRLFSAIISARVNYAELAAVESYEGLHVIGDGRSEGGP
jgi:exodeoxyribonuclease V alpha subunit